MPRRKSNNQEELLTHNIIIRVSEKLFKKLEKLQQKSDSHSIAEVCRKILSGDKIRLFQQDITMHLVMEELAMIRKELRAIGININQITRTFNQDKSDAGRAFYVLKVQQQYKQVGEKTDRLLMIISKLADKWLQG